MCAMVVWASYLLIRAVERPTPRAWTGYAAVMLTACLLHEFAVLALAAHLVALPRAARRAWILAALAVCAGLAPLVVLSTRQSAQVAWIGGLGAGAVAGFVGVTVLGVACAALLGGVRRSQGRVGLTALALPLLVLPAFLLIALTPLKPLYVDRYVLYGHAGTALLVGAALDRLVRAAGRIRTVAVLAVGAAVLALLPAVSSTCRRGAACGRLPEPDSVRGLRDLALDRGPAAWHTLYGTEVPAPLIRSRMLATTRIVALRDPAGQPVDHNDQEVATRRVLAVYFVECRTRHVLGARITVYARPGLC